MSPRRPLRQEAIEIALDARGERMVSDGRLRQWTRRWKGLRDASGALAPPKTPYFWFVGASGALRVGTGRSHCVPAHPSVKAALIAEGGGQPPVPGASAKPATK